MARALKGGTSAGRSGVKVGEMILEALDRVGGVDYLTGLAESDPKLFLHLLEKALPMQGSGEDGSPVAAKLMDAINEGRRRAQS